MTPPQPGSLQDCDAFIVSIKALSHADKITAMLWYGERQLWLLAPEQVRAIQARLATLFVGTPENATWMAMMDGHLAVRALTAASDEPTDLPKIETTMSPSTKHPPNSS